MLRVEAEVMALPPLRLVLGEVPSPEPEARPGLDLRTPNPGDEMKVAVKRTIAHLLKDKK